MNGQSVASQHAIGRLADINQRVQERAVQIKQQPAEIHGVIRSKKQGGLGGVKSRSVSPGLPPQDGVLHMRKIAGPLMRRPLAG